MKILILSRKEALSKGLKFYNDGIPCKRGHICKKRVDSYGCVECTDITRKNWRENTNNHKKELIQNKERWNNLPEEVKEQQREYHRQWTRDNAIHVNEYNKKWKEKNPEKHKLSRLKHLQNNLQRKIAASLRSRLWSVLRKQKKIGSAIRDLGCTLKFLQEHIESLFCSNMTWENWGTVWQLDHKEPLIAFDLTNRVEFCRASHYTNLQPLLIEDHKKKTKSERNKYSCYR